MKRIAIVTGASSGMGREFAKEIFFNSANYKFGKIDELWILARRAERLEELKYSLEKVQEEKNIHDYISPCCPPNLGRAGECPDQIRSGTI